MKKLFYTILLLSFSWHTLFAQEGMLSTGKIPSMKIERTHTVVNKLDNPTNTAYGFSNLQNLTLSMPIPSGTPFTYLSNWYSSNFASSMCKGCDGYYLVDITPTLYSFDEFSGNVQYLGSITGMNGDQPTGIGFNPVDKNFYITSTSNFYSLDIETRVATLIGSLNLTSGGLMIDLCFDLSGTCYAYEVNVSAANAYTINITTGNATAIGVLGYSPNYGQGMSFDFETNTIYLSAFNGGTNTGQLRAMDATTGMTTLITDWGYEQIAPFVISNSSMIMCPCWIGEPSNPNPPSGSTNINISGITLSWTNGVYTTLVEVWFGEAGYLTKVYDGPAITSWPAPILSYLTTYQWKIACKNDTCSTWGPTWFFTTMQDPNYIIDTVHVYPQNIDYWTGTCDSLIKTEVSLVEAIGNYVGWMVFDLSSIPDYKVIEEVTFNGYVYSNSWPYWSITPMNSIVPITDSASEIFSQISTHYEQGIAYSYNQETGTLTNGWLSRDLETNALADLQAALPQDYFAMGIVDFDFNPSFYIEFQGWSEFNKPYLVITWTDCLSSLYPPSNLTTQIIYNPEPQVQLNWQDNSGNEYGFRIYRKYVAPIGQSFYRLIGTVSINTTQFLDSTVIPESVYDYRVFAYNTCGSSGSDTLTIAVPVPVELISFSAEVSDNVITLFWQTATETNNQGFEIERLQDSKIEKLQGWKTIAFVPGFGTTTEPKSYSFVDENVTTGIYKYRLKQIDYDGSFEYSQEIEVEVKAPNVFSLEQNYPNPFNPSTVISYQLPVNGNVTLKVYDILGNEVATLVNEEQSAGSYEVEFNTESSFRLVRNLPSGIYFYKLKAGSFVETKKMILLK